MAATKLRLRLPAAELPLAAALSNQSSSQTLRVPRSPDPAVMSTFITALAVHASLLARSAGPLISSRLRRWRRAAYAGQPRGSHPPCLTSHSLFVCLGPNAVRPIKGLKLVFAPRESCPFKLALVHWVVLIAWPLGCCLWYCVRCRLCEEQKEQNEEVSRARRCIKAAFFFHASCAKGPSEFAPVSATPESLIAKPNPGERRSAGARYQRTLRKEPVVFPLSFCALGISAAQWTVNCAPSVDRAALVGPGIWKKYIYSVAEDFLPRQVRAQPRSSVAEQNRRPLALRFPNSPKKVGWCRLAAGESTQSYRGQPTFSVWPAFLGYLPFSRVSEDVGDCALFSRGD
ncbi:hypothetical protein MRX96_030651 [Rhipicephalus microplus]